jgi:hypothetical protein
MDYYEVLGVPRDASDTEIKRAFHKLARRYHPDRNPGDDEAEARFKQISAAHDVLGDPEKRASFDRGDHARSSDHSPPGGSADLVQADPYLTPSVIEWAFDDASHPTLTTIRLSNRTGRNILEYYPSQWEGRLWRIAAMAELDSGHDLCDFVLEPRRPESLATGKHEEAVTFVIDDVPTTLTVRVSVAAPTTVPPHRASPPPPRKPPPRTASPPPPRSPSERRTRARLLIGAFTIGALALVALVAALTSSGSSSSSRPAPRSTGDAKPVSSTRASTPSPPSTTTTTANAPSSSSGPGSSVATALSIRAGVEEEGNSGTAAYGVGSCGPEQGQVWKTRLTKGEHVAIVWGGENGHATGLDVWPPGTGEVHGSGEGRVTYQSTSGDPTTLTFIAPATGTYPIIIDDSCGNPGSFHFRLTTHSVRPIAARPAPSRPTTTRSQTPRSEEHASPPTRAEPPARTEPTPTPQQTTNAPAVEGGSQPSAPAASGGNPGVAGGSPGESAPEGGNR